MRKRAVVEATYHSLEHALPQVNAVAVMRAALSGGGGDGDSGAGVSEADLAIQSNAPPDEAALNGFRRINSGATGKGTGGEGACARRATHRTCIVNMPCLSFPHAPGQHSIDKIALRGGGSNACCSPS